MLFQGLAWSSEKVYISLKINGRLLTDVEVSLKSEEVIEEVFLSEEALAGFAEILTTEKLNYFKSKDSFDLSEFNKNGMDAVYDYRNLSLNLSIGPDNLKAKKISLINYKDQEEAFQLSNSDFSGFINARPVVSINSPTEKFGSQFDGAVSIGSVVVEGAASYSSNDESLWSRGNIRGIKDFPKYNRRFTFGDISWQPSSYFNFRETGGIQLERNFELTPSKNIVSVAEKEFILREKSRVSVFANGDYLESFDLLPGKYNLADLPINEGVNNLTLKIEDSYGRKRVLNFPYLIDSNLLKKGLSQYVYSIGTPSEANGFNKKYNQNGEDLFISAYHKLAPAKNYNTSFFGQRDSRQLLLGNEHFYTSLLGNLRLDTAYSNNRHKKKRGYAFRPSITWNRYHNNSLNSLRIRFQHEYKSREFGIIGAEDPNNDFSHTLNFSIRKQISRRMSANSSIVRNISRSFGVSSEWRYGVGIQGQIFSNLNYSLNYQRFDQRGQSENNFLAFLNYNFSERNSSLDYNYNSRNRSHRIGARTNSDHSQGQLFANTFYEEDLNSKRGFARFENKHSRIDLFGDLENIKTKSDERSSGSLGAAFGVSFTDKSLSFSRPIQNGFTHISLEGELEDQDISINNSLKGLSPKNDLASTLVLPNLIPFQKNSIFVDISKAEEDLTLKNDHFEIVPYYKIGTFIKLGTDKLCSASANIYNEAKKKVRHELIVLVSKLTKTSYDFFTNDSGDAFLEKIPPGEYLLKTSSGSADIVIPAKKIRFIELGDIYVK